MRKAIETNNGLKGGLLKGKAHYDSNGNPLGGIKAVVTDQGGKAVELESSEVIINKKTVQSDKVLTVKGTPKEILSTLNQMDGNGVAIGDEEAEILAKYRQGGKIPREKHKLYLGEEGGMGVSPKGMFDSAVQMENEGIDSETIRSITGWFRNPFDKLWRFEISDEYSEIEKDFIQQITEYLSKNKDENKAFFKLDKFYKNEDLFKAYPSIKNILVNFIWDENNDDRGSVITSANPEINDLQVKINVYEVRQSSEKRKSDYGTDFKSTLTHELQHVIQIREGLGGGSSFVRQFEKLSEKYKSGLLLRNGRRIAPNGKDDDKNILSIKNKAIKNYQNSSGEIEARDVQNRIDLSSDDRKIAIPYSSIEFNEKYVTVDLERKIIFKQGGELIKRADGSYSRRGLWDNIRDNVGSGRKPTKQMLEQEAKIKAMREGGSISNMTPSELKAFYDTPEGKKLDAQTYAEWKRLVNMTKSELEKFYNSVEGKKAGLSSSEANRQGIDSGRESARWIMKMKDIPYTQWTSNMWRWAKKQINFIKRMSGMKGSLYDEKGNKTRKHTALLIWGHNPELTKGLRKFKGGGELSKKALAVETNDLTDFVRKYFISDGRIDVSDAMQELFGNKSGKSIADEYRKRIGLHKKGGLTISQLAHKLWEEHKDEVREGIDDSDFRNAVEEVLISEYGVSSMINSLIEKSSESEQYRENEYWMNQFDEGDDEYYEDLSDEEVADYFRDMEGFERETYKDEDKKIIISGVEIPKEIDELFKEKYELDYYYSFYGKILNSFPKDEMGLITDSAKNTKKYKDVKQKYDLAKRKADNFNTSKEGKELIKFQGKIRDRMDRMEISRHYRDLTEELAKGTEHEMEHLDTLKKVAEGKLTPEEAVVETASKHLEENPQYYEDLQKMELEALKDKLKSQGYNVTIPSGGNRISVMGYGKGYFNAKKQKADSILSSLKRNGYNAVSKLDADGYYDFWVYADDTKQDLAKMEAENKVSNLDNLISIMDSKVKYQGYSLKELYDEVIKFQGSRDGALIFSEFIKRKKDEGDTKIMDEFNRTSFVENINPIKENEESIPDLIEGLKVLAESLEGAEKKEIEDTIEGLEILLESEDKFAKGGELDNNSMFFEPSKADQEEEKRIMETQFGKNI